MRSSLIPSAVLLLLGADSALAVGCATHTFGHCADGITHWYDPDDGMICDPLDCGGGRAPPKTDVPGCPRYSGTLTRATSASYLSCFGQLASSTAVHASATSGGGGGGGSSSAHVTTTTTNPAVGGTTRATESSGVAVTTTTTGAGGSASTIVVLLSSTPAVVTQTAPAGGSGSGGNGSGSSSSSSSSSAPIATNGAGVARGSLMAGAVAMMGAIIMV